MPTVVNTLRLAKLSVLGTVPLITETCCVCGVVFAMPHELYENRRETGKDFYCPNGHNIHYGSRIKELEQQLAKVMDDADWQRKRANANFELAESEKRRAAAARGQVTKIKKRVAAGVCPCCNRTFQNLSRHMEAQHPDFVSQETK